MRRDRLDAVMGDAMGGLNLLPDLLYERDSSTAMTISVLAAWTTEYLYKLQEALERDLGPIEVEWDTAGKVGPGNIIPETFKVYLMNKPKPEADQPGPQEHKAPGLVDTPKPKGHDDEDIKNASRAMEGFNWILSASTAEPYQGMVEDVYYVQEALLRDFNASLRLDEKGGEA